MIDLSIIILNYNAKDYLQKCLESILKSDLKNLSWEAILVDNNSTDGSQEVLRKLQKKKNNIKILLNKDNFGFSKGNNKAINLIKGRYVLFLNPDTFVEEKSLKEIYNFMEQNPNVGACGPRLDFPDGTLTSASHRGFPTPWNAFTHFSGLSKLFPKSRLFSGYTMGWLLDSKIIHEVDAISGGFFFVRKEAAEQVGWWDEDYFMYGEDIDFCYKLKKKGWKVMFLPHLSVLHYHGVSSGIKKHSEKITTADKSTKLRAAKASAEAMEIFYKKHYDKLYPKLVNGLVLFIIKMLKEYRISKYK